MTAKQGPNPFAQTKRKSPSGKNAPAHSAGSPEDVLFVEEGARGESSAAEPTEPWDGPAESMAEPADRAGDAEPDDVDLVAGLFDHAPAGPARRELPSTEPEPNATTTATTRPAAITPATSPSPAQPAVLPSLPPQPRAGTHGPLLCLVSLVAGAATGAWFAVQGDLWLAAGATALGCAAAMFIRTRRPR